MKILTLTFCIIYTSLLGFTQTPSIVWQKCIGGSNIDNVSESHTLYKTPDGGCIVIGQTGSNDGDVSGYHGLGDCLVVKLDSNGIIEWSKAMGGTGDESSASIIWTQNGNYAMAAGTTSNDGDVFGNHGYTDFWVVKLDFAGGIIWQKCFGGFSRDLPQSINESIDGGYGIVGYTFNNNDGDVSGGHSNTPPSIGDIWLIKIDSAGTLIWQKCLGGTDDEHAFCIEGTSDGGFVVVGQTQSNDFDVNGLHSGSVDIWVVKLDSLGNIDWQKCLGGSFTDIGHSIIQTRDGGYALTGLTSSRDGDITDSLGLSEAWVVKLNSFGIIEWQHCYGGSDWDTGKSIKQTADGGFLIGIETSSIDFQVSLNHGWEDYWIVKTDSLGIIEWEKSIGGSNGDIIASIDLGIDSSIFALGVSWSNDGDVSLNHGNSDLWVVKLATIPDGISAQTNVITDFLVYQNLIGKTVDISFYTSEYEKVNLQLIDITGRILLQDAFSATSGLNKHHFFTGDLLGGIYFARLQADGGAVTKKVVIQ